MAIENWENEIERKYKINSEEEFLEVEEKITNLISDVRKTLDALQKDWVPDFEDDKMKKNKILLRLRENSFNNGGGSDWLLTLKYKSVVGETHQNKELEISPSEIKNLEEIQNFLLEKFGINFDYDSFVKSPSDYLKSLGLTKDRMYIEKNRKEYESENSHVKFALDQLPKPINYFLEIEAKSQKDVENAERSLNLNLEKITDDYGEIVKFSTNGRSIRF